MKKWNTPEIDSLKVEETANGFWCSDHETSNIFEAVLGGCHDGNAVPPTEPGKPADSSTTGSNGLS